MTTSIGNTYPVRRELRALGADWDAGRKGWIVSDDLAAAASALVDGGRRSPSLQTIGGGRGYLGTDRYGRAHFGAACGCEDYPCCGCGQ